MSLSDGIRALLLDIEGTTTPISFVYEVLFPFARERLVEACSDVKPGSATADAIVQLRSEYDAELLADDQGLPDFGSGAPYAAYLMDQDRKSTGLKALQGIIWQQGYETGALLGQVFADVPSALVQWQQRGLSVKIYSSGSIQAQKLLFGYSEHGDLTRYLSGYHDTTTGPKKEPASYAAIVAGFDLHADEVLFLSDVVDELDAAAAAGLRTGLLIRPGNQPAGESCHPSCASFGELI